MAAASSSTPFLEIRQENNQSHQITQHQSSADAAPPVVVPQKKRRNQPGTSYPDAEVIALSPKTLMATNRFVCEVCNKGFQREQNLQLHRRGHNLPWKLKQKSNNKDQQPPKRKVYLCPEPTCVHHEPSRALGDLTGIKKHFSRKHGEKKWKCDKCSKKYAVQSDWKAHSKTCGTREYRCDCGTIFSRRDSFITHRAFCDALAHESGRHPSNLNNPLGSTHNLYGTNHVMSLGLSQLQHHNNQQAAATNSTMMLSLASSAPPKYENLMNHHSSFGVVQQQQSPQQQSLMSSSPFFNMTSDPNQQGFQGEPLFSSNKQQLHGLMQLPDRLQGTNNNNNNTSAFNLSFFPNSNSSGSNISDQFNNLSEGGNQGTTTLYTNSPVSNNHQHQVGCSDFSSLFANNSSSVQVQQQESMSSPHMSATALLQKASQMGSTTTTSGGCSILRGMGDHNSSSSNGEGMRSSMENEHHHHNHNNLRGLMMNSLANGINTSMFGNVVKGNHQFQSVEEPNKKLSSQNLGVCFAGSDNKLTLDFLGVNGGMVRNSASGHGFSQREQQLHNMGTMNSSMDPKLEPTQPNQPFGSSTLQ